MDSADLQAPPSGRSSNADGNLLALITAGLYGVFTLVPGSSSLMVTWPWVALWQATLLLPMLWLLWQLWHKPWGRFRLGNGFDWLAGLAVVGLGLSTLVADFPQQARWYAWAALGMLAALYALTGWLTPQRARRLLQGQAYLSLALIGVSLTLWLTRVYLPELSRLATLRSYGVDQGFDFSLGSLRNWYPIGHQNYVAGYLVLVLPLFLGLALQAKTWQRWLWGLALGLGLVALYTTNSRAGVLALMAFAIAALVGLLFNSRISKRVLVPASLAALVSLGALIIANPRFQTTFAAIRQGGVFSGQLTYRIVTNAVGLAMGRQRPWAGLGPGSVPLVYQQHRPFWAGREAELQYQLHSTPAQLWAELGGWGLLLPLAGALLLAVALWRWQRRVRSGEGPAPVLLWSLVGAFWAYGVFSLTDYQLDVLAISGVIVIYLAVILAALRPSQEPLSSSAKQTKARRLTVGLGLGLGLAMLLWLVPIHRAWAASAQGFSALQQDGDVATFAAELEQAHQLAPWEAYYPFQLGWVLGNLSYQATDAAQASRLRTDARDWLQRGNQSSPYQEFGHSNLGWLNLQENPSLATADFARSAELVAAKMGVFFGLGYSLLLSDRTDLAVEAMALEIIRHPLLLTSSIWRIDQFAAIYPAVLTRVENLLNTMVETATDPPLIRLLHQLRGTLRWWTDDLAGASQDWDRYGTEISRAVLKAAVGAPPNLDPLPEYPGKYALKAWYDPANRRRWLEQAWVTLPEDVPQLAEALPPADRIDSLVNTMNASDSFDQWLKENAPTWQPRSERLGFGLLSRHDDGLSPVDFYPRLENLPMAKFFEELVPSPVYLPSLDRQLQPYRLDILSKL